MPWPPNPGPTETLALSPEPSLSLSLSLSLTPTLAPTLTPTLTLTLTRRPEHGHSVRRLARRPRQGSRPHEWHGALAGAVCPNSNL
eukprot:scaffold116887_cov48-Phaeocystis_antarctica.AAC.1